MQNNFIKNQTDKCVYCGLCVSNCPTYQVNQLETESPRGRVISISQAINHNTLISQRFIEQINNCLQCGNCDQVCPAKIPITELISQTKNAFSFKSSKYLWFAKNSDIFAKFAVVSKLLLPKAMQLNYATQKFKPTLTTTENAEIGLFSGCTGDIFDHDTKNAIINILNQLKINFTVPKPHKCCGSLHYHSGDFTNSTSLLNQNSNIISTNNIKKILYFTSGCKTNFQKLAEVNNIEVYEITDFLSQQDLTKLHFKPLKANVAVHIPCSHQDNPDIETNLSHILSNIPELKFKFIKTSCCGSAGTHMLTNKSRANKMRQHTLKLLTDCDLVLTTNIGCRLHLARGLKTVKIAHPLFLLNRQLQ